MEHGRRHRDLVVKHFDYASTAAERSYKDLPADVKWAFGFDLWQVQRGLSPASGKTLKGFGGADVRELLDDDEAGTYRVVYTVRFHDALYILHAFQKKSKRGIATDRQTIDLIKQRLREAEAKHSQWLAAQTEA